MKTLLAKVLAKVLSKRAVGEDVVSGYGFKKLGIYDVDLGMGLFEIHCLICVEGILIREKLLT